MQRVSLLTLLVLVLTGWTSPAHADTTPLRLTSYTVTPSVALNPRGPVTCDANNYFDCGLVGVDAYFSGLKGRERPGPGDYQFVLGAGGTVEVSRTYGCQTGAGTRVRTYDRKVKQTQVLALRRSPAVPIPAGDTVRIGVYAFLFDAQPGNCPVGTRPMMYELEAKQVRLELTSAWAAIPSATYALPGRTVWKGAVPTPATDG